MRKDMAKRFLEPGRGAKGRFPRHCKQYSITDEDGQNINNPHGMKKAHRLTIKNQNYGDIGTDFSVLRRFLRSRVGQSWDKVYSEVCAEADTRSFQGHHLREWLDYEVEQNCFMQDGKVIDQRGLPLGRYWRRGEFFVHPETGILEFVKAERGPESLPPAQKVFDLDGVLYTEYDGVWYRVKMKEISKKPSRFMGNSYMVYDELEGLNDKMIKDFGKDFPWRILDRLKRQYGLSPNRKAWYCTWKQSANSKEIAKLKKHNKAA